MLKFVFAMKRAQIVKVIAPFSSVITELFYTIVVWGYFKKAPFCKHKMACHFP